MRKTLVAVAAALAFGSLSAHAGDVQMYGVIDVGGFNVEINKFA